MKGVQDCCSLIHKVSAPFPLFERSINSLDAGIDKEVRIDGYGNVVRCTIASNCDISLGHACNYVPAFRLHVFDEQTSVVLGPMKCPTKRFGDSCDVILPYTLIVSDAIFKTTQIPACILQLPTAGFFTVDACVAFLHSRSAIHIENNLILAADLANLVFKNSMGNREVIVILVVGRPNNGLERACNINTDE